MREVYSAKVNIPNRSSVDSRDGHRQYPAMMFALIASASLLAAPQPNRKWFTVDDMLMNEVPANGMRTVHIRMRVTPAGRTFDCEVEVPSGSPKLDAHTCAISMRRARFKPARWSDGQPAWGVYRVPIRYVVADYAQELLPATEILLRVAAFPPGVKQPAFALLAVATDATGKIVDCTKIPMLKERIQPQLTSPACSHVKRSIQLQPARDESGTAVPSVQTVSTLFYVEKK